MPVHSNSLASTTSFPSSVTMMTIKQGDNERRIQCPYESSHLIIDNRMAIHLVKCRRSHPNTKKVTCLYNATHQVLAPELKYHHQICGDRISMDKFLVVPDKVNTNKYPVPQLSVQASENWDDECHPKYDPSEYCRNNIIIRNNVIHTQPSAVRRKFRLEERQRVQQLNSSESSTSSRPNQSEPPRRPAEPSDGQQNCPQLEDGPVRQIDELLAKVNLDSKVVTTPKLSAQPENDENTPVNDNLGPNESTGAIRKTTVRPNRREYENEYPPLGESRGVPAGRVEGSRGAAPLVNTKPMVRSGRGRGTRPTN